MSQNAAVFGGGAFGSKRREVELGKIGGDVRMPPLAYQPQSLRPVVGGEIVLRQVDQAT